MPNLEEVYGRLKAKKREKGELQRSFRDELAQHPRYPQLVEQLAQLKEEKKAIENQVRAGSSADAEKIDLLTLDIKSDREMLSGIALTMYARGQQVEIVDEQNVRWVPSFTVAFKKEDALQEESAPAAAAEPEPAFAP